MPYVAPLPIQRGKHVTGLPPVFAGGVDSTPPQNFPDFWPVQRPKPGDPTTIQYAVMWGYLGYGDVPDNPVSIDGAPDDPFQPSELEWEDWDGSDGAIWLEANSIDLTQPTISDQVGDVKVNSDAAGGSFDPTEAPWTDGSACVYGIPDGTVSYLTDQSLFLFLLCKYKADEHGNLQFDMPRVRGPLELKSSTILGNFCIYPGVREL